MLAYENLRPETAAYGPWKDNAPAGTITDDSRLKIILMRAVRESLQSHVRHLSQTMIANQLICFQPLENEPPNPRLLELVDEGLAEYRMARPLDTRRARRKHLSSYRTTLGWHR